MKRIGSSLRSYIKHPISGSKKRRTVRRTSIILSLSTLAVIILLPITLMRLYGSESLDAFLTRDIQQLVTQVKLILPFGLLGAVSWVIWLVRWILSRTYQPTVNNFRTTTSVVIPSYREDPDVLVRCLDTWLNNQPDEVILVVDLAAAAPA